MLYGYLNSPFVSNQFSDAAIPPSSVASPVISGTGVIGQTLSTTNGTWSGTLPITYTYQWNRNGSVILGATFNTYTLVTADGSTSITCTVTATNAGGSLSKSSNAISVAAATDADADAFIAAAAITNPTQKSAIDKLVVDLKSYGIWSKMKAIYPMVGGSSSAHKFNLRNPIDSDSAFRLVFNGGWVHSSTGSTPNGTNAYAETFFNPSLNFSLFNYHFSYYSRTNSLEGNKTVMGSGDGYTPMMALKIYNPTAFEAPNFGGSAPSYIETTGLGHFIGNRTSQNLSKVFRNGIVKATSVTSATSTINVTKTILIGAFRQGNAIESFTNKESATASIGDSLTDTQAANYYTAVQAFQTTLGRNV